MTVNIKLGHKTMLFKNHIKRQQLNKNSSGFIIEPCGTLQGAAVGGKGKIINIHTGTRDLNHCRAKQVIPTSCSS